MIECFMFCSRQCDEIHTIMGKNDMFYTLKWSSHMVHQCMLNFFLPKLYFLVNNRFGEDNDIQQRHFGNTELIYKCKKWWWDEYKNVALYSVPQKINSVCTKNMHVTM